jgi:hypothetical protein
MSGILWLFDIETPHIDPPILRDIRFAYKIHKKDNIDKFKRGCYKGRILTIKN